MPKVNEHIKFSIFKLIIYKRIKNVSYIKKNKNDNRLFLKRVAKNNVHYAIL
jgi:hypothetical protein